MHTHIHSIYTYIYVGIYDIRNTGTTVCIVCEMTIAVHILNHETQPQQAEQKSRGERLRVETAREATQRTRATCYNDFSSVLQRHK